MAERRCFTKKITQSDAFLEMPLSSQCLYFHLNMEADDDGFVGNPRRIMRMIGASEDDLKLLIAKRFLLAFESQIVVIKHWWLHNTLMKDRYTPTSYQDEAQLITKKDNKSYTLKLEEEIENTNDNILITQDNIKEIKLKERNIKEVKNIDYIDSINQEQIDLTLSDIITFISSYSLDNLPPTKCYEYIIKNNIVEWKEFLIDENKERKHI